MWLSQPKLAIFVLHWWISLSTSRTSGIEHSICLGRVILTNFNMFRFHRWLSGFDASLKNPQKVFDNMLQSFHGTDCSTEFHRPLNSRELSCLACAVSAALQCRALICKCHRMLVFICVICISSHISPLFSASVRGNLKHLSLHQSHEAQRKQTRQRSLKHSEKREWQWMIRK